MSCNSSENLFEGYLDGTLAPAQRARLLAHVNGCGRCKGVLDELRAVYREQNKGKAKTKKGGKRK